MELTEGALLGGRLIYRQPVEGFRTGIEPVLLAASVAARPGEHVLEGGTGAGAGLLCLLARVPGLFGCGVERDEGLAGLARANLAANAMSATIAAMDLLDLPPARPFDHAIANPPWHDARSTASGVTRRDTAKRAWPGLLAGWSAALSRQVRDGGSVTLIVSAASAAEALAALGQAGCLGLTLLPLWPRAGQEARLVLVRGIKAGRGACRVLPGLVLHEGDGYSAAVRAILWDGTALPWV